METKTADMLLMISSNVTMRIELEYILLSDIYMLTVLKFLKKNQNKLNFNLHKF